MSLRSGQQASRQGASPRDWLVLLAMLLVFVPAIHFAWRLFETDWLVLPARKQLVKWSTGQAPLKVADWVEARNRTQQALLIEPKNPTLHDLLAALYTLRARQSPKGSAFYVSMYSEAALHQRAALALRPGHGWTWAALAESLLALDPSSPQGWEAWQQASQYGPHEILVTATLFHVAQRAGQQAPPEVQLWLRKTAENAPSRLRKMLGLPLVNAPK